MRRLAQSLHMRSLIAVIFGFGCVITVSSARADAPSDYADLVDLFEDWRAFEPAEFRKGVPDYSSRAVKRKAAGLRKLKKRLSGIDPADWSIDQQIDYYIVRAEMNGMDFDLRVLEPWRRDPAFYQQVWAYQSDTPAHEGPTNHALIDLWQFSTPFSEDEQSKLINGFLGVRKLLEAARANLDGDAKDIWLAGIKTMAGQAADIDAFIEAIDDGGNKNVISAARDARTATLSFVEWLERQAPTKDGPSGIGVDQYDWYLKNVHLSPFSWREEKAQLERALFRARTTLKLEEQRNRGLPALRPVGTAYSYGRRARQRVDKYVSFLRRNAIISIEPYTKQSLLDHLGSYREPEDRNFFHQATHREPMTLFTHYFQWWDLARMQASPHPSPIRQGPLLYNIFDSRSEGMATAMEEMMLHAGLYDDNPRAREIVWVMQAQRAARGLASLYAHANEFSIADAADFHVEWTPRDWIRRDLGLLSFEQQLYLRQPGYGTSDITGKNHVERLFAKRVEAEGEDYSTKDFFAELNAAGLIPMSLIEWRLTGEKPDFLDDIE